MRAALVIAALGMLAACGDAGSSPVADVAPDAVGDATADGAADVVPDATPDATPDVAGLCGAVSLPSLRLTTEGTELRDALGRAVRLRGVNAGGRSKLAPFMPFAFAPEDPSAPAFDVALAAYLDRVRDWGLDVLRLPFTWEAVEPERGHFDATFLARLDAYVAAAGERGLRVVLDMHQDVFARPYCGDGFPLWAMADVDVPKPADCSAWFTQYYLNKDMQHDFDRFWSNADGLMDAFEAMWTMMATRYATADAVVGFEIINEPGWGSGDMDTFSHDVLSPFYTRMVGVVHAVAPDRLVFVDPTGVDGVLVTTALLRPDGDGIVFAPHYYDGLALAGGDLEGATDPAEKLAGWRDVGLAWDVPVMLGEFGIANDLDGAAAFMRRHWDALDALGMHGTQWEYSVTGDGWNAEAMSVVDADGSERATAGELVRAYPEAVAGHLVKWVYDQATRRGELDLEADGTSWITAPARLYPEGLDAEVLDGAGCVRWDADAGRLIVGGAGAVRVGFGPR
ncbi:MAG: cellulase family glycosylhydrolase [Myxococcota bacterium]